MIAFLKTLFPRAKIMLRYSCPLELLVAVILSAQCTDAMVNRVTEKLFKKYRTLKDYLRADPEAFQKDIHSTGFFRNKTKNILSATKMIAKDFCGEVPNTMEQILKIPGVGRKTANVVLGNAFGVVSGIAVDTHVKRLAKRFFLTKESDPEKIEKDLMKIVPKKEWLNFTYLLIEYGRKYSPARAFYKTNDPLWERLKKERLL